MDEDCDTEDGLGFDFEEFRYSDLDSLTTLDNWTSGSVDTSSIRIDSTWFE